MINEPTLTETRIKLEIEIANLKDQIEYREHMLESLADIAEYRTEVSPEIQKETSFEELSAGELGKLFG